MPIKGILIPLSVAALFITGCGQQPVAPDAPPPPSMPSAPSTTPENTGNTGNNDNNGTPGGNHNQPPAPQPFQPPRPQDVPDNGCYKNFDMVWPGQGEATAQSVYDENGNEVQFRTFSPNGVVYAETTSVFNADGELITSEAYIEGVLASSEENEYDEAGFRNSHKSDDTGDGNWNSIWTAENHTAEGPTQGKRRWVRLDNDADGLIDAKGGFTYDETTGNLTAVAWDRRENGKINTSYTVENTPGHEAGATETWYGTPQFHPYSVTNTYELIAEKQRRTESVTTYADGQIDVVATNTFNSETGALTSVAVDLKGDQSVDYEYVVLSTNDLGEVTVRERHVNGVPYNKTVFTYVTGTDLISSITEYEIELYTPNGTNQWLETDLTRLFYNEDNEILREQDESFDSEGETTGESVTEYIYDEETGELATITYDDLLHGDSLLEAVYTYSNWSTDEAGQKTGSVSITRLSNCGADLIFNEGVEIYDAEDNLHSGTYTAPTAETAGCENWYNEEEQTITNSDGQPLTVKSDRYANDDGTWDNVETYTWAGPDQIASYEEDSNGDGVAEQRLEFGYDDEGRFHSYKSDGDSDADADGSWDFILTAQTECVH